MKDPRMTLHMCGLGLALAPCFCIGVHRKVVRFHHHSTFRGLQKKQRLFFPMLSLVLFINTPDGWSIGFEVPDMCAVHLDPPRCREAILLCSITIMFLVY